MGYPGAGKTTIARLVAELTDSVHIWADTERHILFGQPTHSHTESKQLYDLLNTRTTELLRAGTSVVFDTNFNFRADRDLLQKIANDAGATMTIIWVTTAVDIAKQRAVHANVVRNGYDFVMSSKQFDAIADKMETPGSDEPVLQIDGQDVTIDKVRQLLQENRHN
jgi:predicted kinase